MSVAEEWRDVLGTMERIVTLVQKRQCVPVRIQKQEQSMSAYATLVAKAAQMVQDGQVKTVEQGIDALCTADPALVGKALREPKTAPAQELEKSTVPANTAWEVIKYRAEGRVTRGEAATFAQAVDQVVQAHPELYASYEQIAKGGRG